MNLDWSKLQAMSELRQALWDLDCHNGWATALVGNSLAQFDVAYHRAEAAKASERAERARAKLAPHLEEAA